MSFLNDCENCVTKNGSNIPVVKRISSSGRKKSKVQAQFPELQKYIQSIINTNSERDFEDVSDKNEITSKVEKPGNYEMGNENKKVAKGKFKFNLNSKNLNERVKTAFSVSSRENISNQFYSHFVESRNWDIVTAQNDKNFKIANVLKNLFPNPFELTKIPEFNKSKISMYIEKIVRVDVTLPDVIVSESDPPKILHSTRVAKIFEADYDKNSTQMDSWTLNSSVSVKNHRSKTAESCERTNFPDDFAIYPVSDVIGNLVNYKRNNATNKHSSYETTREKRERVRASIQSEKRIYEESNFLKQRREKTPKIFKNSRQQILDCDLGKLKLLTLTDSDDSSKDPSKKKVRKLGDDLNSKLDTSGNSRDDKFLLLSNVTNESGMVKGILNDLSQKHEVNQTKARSRSKSNGREWKTIKQCKSKCKKLVKSHTEKNCPKIVENEFDNYKEPNLKVLKNIKDEEKKRERSKSEDNRLKLEDKEMVKASEKIDEVLKFMSDCLMRLGNENVPVRSDRMKKANTSENRKGKKCFKLNSACAQKSNQNLHSTTEATVTPQTSILTSTSWRQSTAVISHSSEVTSQNVEFDHIEILDPGVVNAVFSDSIAINNDTITQTVEIQNELGGYAEEQQTELSGRDLRLSKSVLPLSVKIKQNKRSTYEVLKTALEREEKLMSEEFSVNKLTSRNDFFENHFEMLDTKSHNSRSVTSDFRRQNSSFVICLNSLPRKERGRNLMSFSFFPRLISFYEIPKPIIHSLPYCEDSRKGELKLSEQHFVTQYALRVEVMLIMYRSIVSHIWRPIGVSVTMASSKVEEEMSLKNSESRIIRKYKSIKKTFYLKPSSPPKAIDYALENFQKIDFDSSSVLNGQIKELEDAVKQTEKVYFLEQSCSAICTGSKTSTSSKNETVTSPNCQFEEESAKLKIQDLLLRTYNLQQKLRHHLHRLTTKPTSISCPSICQEEVVDFGIQCRNSDVIFRESEKASDDTKVYWSFKPPKNSNVPTQVFTSEIQKTDQSTNYEPMLVEEFKETEVQDKNFDDRSSLDSFKSSNDLSEGEKELPVLQKEGKTKQVQFLRNICNEIELFKNRIMSKEEKENGVEDWTEACETVNTSTKMLKTVFKGKESMTELSLGLKSVPLGKVNNISVEKEKISENHTKISICISKEKVKKQSISKDMVHKRLSYCLDSAKTSLTSFHTDSKAESEDDEDDFKSVVSTLSGRHSETDFLDELKEGQKMELVPPKFLAKHRFDFYKKMDGSNKITHKSMSNTSCTYKEFEPLKKAFTEMQIRMKSLKRDGCFGSNDYYQRALKLAKMSAGYCKNCGSRTVIPQDTFGYYNTILPRNQSHCHQSLNLRTTPPHSSYYSLRSSVAEFSDHIRDLDLQYNSSYLLNSSRTIIRNPLNDISIYSDVL